LSLLDKSRELVMKSYITQRPKGIMVNGQEGFFSYSPQVKAIGDKEGAIRFTLTDPTLDRYSEVVLPKGAVLTDYKRNPVVLWAHNFAPTDKTPIGKLDMKSVEITEDFFDADVIFDMNDEFAVKLYNKYAEGFLNAGSIGFYPITMSKEPVAPKQQGITHVKWGLLEFSGVPIPANPAALAQREYAQFAQECREMGHPLDAALDQYYEPQQYFYSENIMEEKDTDSNTVLDDLKFVHLDVDDFDTIGQAKAGKVLSKKNRELISKTVEAMTKVLEGLNALLTATEESPEKLAPITNTFVEDILKPAAEVQETLKLLNVTNIMKDIRLKHS